MKSNSSSKHTHLHPSRCPKCRCNPLPRYLLKLLLLLIVLLLQLIERQTFAKPYVEPRPASRSVLASP
jgi:hypothetical protein